MRGRPAKRYISIRTKLVGVFLCTIGVPLIIFGSLLYAQLSKLLENEALRSAQRELVQMADRMSLQFTQVQSVSNLFYLDEEILDHLRRYADGDAAAGNLARAVLRYRAGLNNVNFQVAIVEPGGRVFGNPLFLGEESALDLSEHGWNSYLDARPSDIIWVSDAVLDEIFSSPGYPYAYAVRRLHDPEAGWSSVGTLIVGISELEILKMYSGYVAADQSVYLLDTGGNLISALDSLGTERAALFSADEIAGYSGAFLSGKGRERILVCYHTINATQWKLVTCTRLSTLMEPYSGTMRMYLAILLTYLGATIVLCGVLARRFVRPVHNLHHYISLAREGDLSVRVPVVSNDEVGEVTEQFNDMIARVGALMDDVREEQTRKREAEIQSLQSQINPHFLYNTLASIRYMVYTGNKEDADSIILALIRLMKNTLSDSSEFISVEKELDLLRDYIHIQQLAFSRTLRVDIDVPDELLQCKTIKLLLQPIVENAILHGLKPKKGDCRLRIRGRIAGDALEFVVEDNGVGFDGDAAAADSRYGSGVGIENVRNRIQLTFGREYGLEVRSRRGEGTTVTLRLPRLNNEGGYASYEHIDRG